MKSPNLCWALSERGTPHWKFANLLHIDPSAFSRRLNGRCEFTALEMARVSELLCLPEEWLFQVVVPPPATASESTEANRGQ
jgi:hypothetical protein